MKPSAPLLNLGWQGRIVLGLLLASWLVPSSREVQVLCGRLLFGIHTSQTEMIGQPPGCVIYVVPTVRHTEAYRQKLRANSAASPDAFLLSGIWFVTNTQSLPPVEQWRSHPLLEAAVLDYGFRINFSNAPPAVQAYFVDLLAMAKESQPSNGAWRLLEANWDFERGQTEAAVGALRAAIKLEWQAHRREQFDYLVQLWVAAGLSRLDAAQEANYHGKNLEVHSRILRQVANLIGRTVSERQLERARELLELHQGLVKKAWVDSTGQASYLTRRWPSRASIAMHDAMAADLHLPQIDKVWDYERQQEAQTNILHQYLTRHWGGEYAKAFREAMSNAERAADPYNAAAERKSNKLMWAEVVLASLGSELALYMSCATLIVLLLSFTLPYRHDPNQEMKPRIIPRQRAFWIISTVAILVWIGLFFRIDRVIYTGEIGFPAIAETSPAGSVATTVFACVATAALLLLFWLAATEKPQTAARNHRRLLCLLGWSYLLVLGIAAAGREWAVWIMSNSAL